MGTIVVVVSLHVWDPLCGGFPVWYTLTHIGLTGRVRACLRHIAVPGFSAGLKRLRKGSQEASVCSKG